MYSSPIFPVSQEFPVMNNRKQNKYITEKEMWKKKQKKHTNWIEQDTFSLYKTIFFN